MTKKINWFITSKISKPMKGQGSTGLRSERDKSVHFWLWGGYLLYNAVIAREN